MIQCQICQVTNEDAAQFCKECGGRLQSAAAPMAPSVSPPAQNQSFGDAEPVRPDPPKRPRLHSPILGGGSEDFDDETSAPSFNKKSKSGQSGPAPASSSQSGTGGQRRGLRSPLLGGDVDDMDEEDIISPKAKGGFGGGKPKRTEFPHRHHDEIENPEPHPQAGTGGQQKSTGSRGLRSPLLGGSDDDYDDEPAPRGRAAKPPKQSASGRLRSPILGGGDDYYDDYEDRNDEPVEINDPSVLRSPLLAVRTPKAPTQPSAAPVNIQAPEPKTAPFVQGPYTQASGSAPNFAVSATPAASVAVPSMQMEAPVQPAPGGNFAPGPSASASGIVAPQAPSQQPAYSPPPAPAPLNNHNQNAPQQNFGGGNDSYTYGQPSSAVAVASPPAPMPQVSPSYQAPLPPAPSSTKPNQQALPPTNIPQAPAPTPVVEPPSPAPTARATGTKFDAAGDEDAPKQRGMRGSKLLGDVSDDPVGPMDRRSRFSDRRTPSKSDRRASSSLSDTGDHEPVQTLRGTSYQPSSAPAAPNPMAPLLMASAVIALMAKGYFLSTWITKPGIFGNAATFDQLGEMVVLVGIVLFAMRASQKS